MSTTVHVANEQQTDQHADNREYLTFELSGENYGVDILRVQEIKGYMTATRIPNTPDYLKGVLNLRGTIVPIVDLRLKFAMGITEPTPLTVVIVVNIGERVIGILADAVSDVLDLSPKDIQPPPELGSAFDISCIAGIGNANDHLVTLLNIDRVLFGEEVKAVSAIPTDIEKINEQD